jgi:hypothetical protein
MLATSRVAVRGGCCQARFGPKTTASDACGFAIAKIREGLVSPGDRN